MYLSRRTDPFQVHPGYPAPAVEPAAVPGAVRFFEFVGFLIADKMPALPGNPWDNVQVELTDVVQGYASFFQPDLVGVIVVLGQRVLQDKQVIPGLPGSVGVHHDLDVGIVLVVVAQWLDEGVEAIRALAVDFLVPMQVATKKTVHVPYAHL